MPSAARAYSPEPPRHRYGGERTAERILDAAEELFAERGYNGTTLRDVATRVGVRPPSLYNHFASKDALYAAVLERGIGPLMVVLARTAAAPASEPSDPERLVSEVMAILARRPGLPRLVQHETLAGGQRLTPILRSWIVPAFERAHELVAASPAAGRWSAEQIPLLVLAMYQVVVGYFTFAPFYRDLGGGELLGDAALEAQTRFLRELVTRLFGAESEGTSRGDR
jgi:TetR/AcrR family transcriptional regulator